MVESSQLSLIAFLSFLLKLVSPCFTRHSKQLHDNPNNMYIYIIHGWNLLTHVSWTPRPSSKKWCLCQNRHEVWTCSSLFSERGLTFWILLTCFDLLNLQWQFRSNTWTSSPTEPWTTCVKEQDQCDLPIWQHTLPSPRSKCVPCHPPRNLLQWGVLGITCVHIFFPRTAPTGIREIQAWLTKLGCQMVWQIISSIGTSKARSLDAVSTVLPLGAKSTSTTASKCPTKVLKHLR